MKDLSAKRSELDNLLTRREKLRDLWYHKLDEYTEALLVDGMKICDYVRQARDLELRGQFPSLVMWD